MSDDEARDPSGQIFKTCAACGRDIVMGLDDVEAYLGREYHRDCLPPGGRALKEYERNRYMTRDDH